MVQRFLKLFHSEFSGIHKAAIILALSSGGSSLLAIFRDRLLAGTFGAGRNLDIYYASFRVPDILYVVSLSIVSVTVLIPFFLDKLSISKEETDSFLNGIFTVFIFGMSGIALVAFFAAPYLAGIIAPGFSIEDQNQLIILSRILLLSPVLLGLSNLFSSVVQSFRRFLIYALSPILYNIGIIVGIAVFFPIWGLNGIAGGVVLGALMHFLIQVPGVLKLGFLPRISFNINFPEIWKIIRFSFPRTIGLGMNQLVFIFITSIASILSAGSIAVFNLSYNLQAVPLGLIGVSYSVAAFPTLSRLFIKNKKEDFLKHIITAARHIIFWSIPASMLFIVLRAQIVRVIFGYGEFGWSDTRLTAAGLAVFSVSIVAQALIILFVRGFYAAGITKKPVLVNVFSSLFIVASSFYLVKIFNSSGYLKFFFEAILRVEGVNGGSILMLPFAFSIGMILNCFVLWKLFRAEFGRLDGVLRKTFFQSLASAVIMGFTVYLSLLFFGTVFNTETFVGIFLQGFLSGIIGIATGFCFLKAVKNRELEEITSSLKQKFWKENTVVPEHEDLS